MDSGRVNLCCVLLFGLFVYVWTTLEYLSARTGDAEKPGAWRFLHCDAIGVGEDGGPLDSDLLDLLNGVVTLEMSWNCGNRTVTKMVWEKAKGKKYDAFARL